MVTSGRSYISGDVPKSLVSLVLGILAVIAVLLSITILIINPIDLTGEMSQEIPGRLSIVFISLIAGFGLGMSSWITACHALPVSKSQPHWKMCRVCASAGIAFGVLAMLSYLVFIVFLPILLPIPK